MEVLTAGQLFIKSGADNLVVHLNTEGNNPEIKVIAINNMVIKRFACELKAIFQKENYYRFKKLRFDVRINFLDISYFHGELYKIKPELIAHIRACTGDKLISHYPWRKYGLPLKRCVVINGKTGEVISSVCQALMKENGRITCIVADATELERPVINDLYNLAYDLRPSIVFIANLAAIKNESISEISVENEKYLHYLIEILNRVERNEKIITIGIPGSIYLDITD